MQWLMQMKGDKNIFLFGKYSQALFTHDYDSAGHVDSSVTVMMKELSSNRVSN